MTRATQRRSPTSEDANGEWLVGTSTVNITPDPAEPHHLVGLSGRDGPMDGIDHDIFARAIALEDRAGRRMVVLSFELIDVAETLRTFLAAECETRWGIEPDALLLNPSHNHYGPDYYRELDDEHVAAYRDFLDETLLSAIGSAVEDLEPASLAYHEAQCAIAINRRHPREDRFHFDPYPGGPVDHDLPVLRVETADGTTKALLFGYAAHPTVATGSNVLNGDWPGYAMKLLEDAYPDATAAFLIGAAGDQRAYPQGTLEYVKKHAQTVATAVERALDTDPRPVRGPLSVAAGETGLDLEEPITDDEGREVGKEVIDHRPYPIQAFGFGTDLTILSLTGEVVADTALRLKDTLNAPLWVAGYANSAGYIPTRRILAEGSYESWTSGTDGTYAPSTEERVREKAVALAEQVGARRKR